MAAPVRTLISSSRPPACATCGTPAVSRARQVESIAHCVRCGEDLCWLDGIPLSRHRRCAACQVLVGSHHATTHVQGDLCPSCARWLDKGLPVPEEDPSEDELVVGS